MHRNLATDCRRVLSWTLLALCLLTLWIALSMPLKLEAQGPALTTISEGLFGRHSGQEKKESAMSFMLAAVQLKEAVARREVVDAERFKEGLSKMIDAVVECLNASSWAGR